MVVYRIDARKEKVYFAVIRIKHKTKMNTDELIQENRHLKHQLSTLSKTHAKDMQRPSDMIDFRNNAIRKMRDAKGRYHTELACRALYEILPENVKEHAPLSQAIADYILENRELSQPKHE